VEYNSDPDYHSGLLKREAEPAKPVGRKKGSGLRAQSTLPVPPDVGSEAQTPTGRSNGDTRTPSRQSPRPMPLAGAGARTGGDDRPISPVSTASSTSESPLAQRVRMNGINSQTAGSVASVSSSNPVAEATSIQNESASAADSAPSWPPTWLSSGIQVMQAKYPDDRFELSLRQLHGANPEWRIRCRDCPGKLYTPGPGETLLNYEVHLKNRQHRQRVNDRLSNVNS